MAATTAAVDFQLVHQKEFALEIMAYDTLDASTVVEVRCLFCVHAQPPQPQPVQTWHIFVPVLYQRHHEVQHAREWERYQKCSSEEKDLFFKNYTVAAGPGASAGAGAGAAGAGAGAAAGESGAVVVVKRGRGRPRKEAAGVAPPPVAAVEVKEKRPRGRPRKNGATGIQWTDEMSQRLLQLRTETFANWFASESRSMKHDGWKLVTSTIADEFGVVVDPEQCQSKMRLLKSQDEKRSESSNLDNSFAISSSEELQQPIGQKPASSTTAHTSLAARQARRSSWPQPSERPAAAAQDETQASVAVEKKANGDASSAEVPVKRGRGRPRRDSYPLARPTPANISVPPQKKQRVHLGNDVGSGSNTVLLQKILRATEEQKDALIAQKKAAEAQTASIQELLQFLKTRAEI